MKIIGIIGWKNSGKTFLAQQIISVLSSKGLKVASIKHAHDGFDIDHPQTDSFLHRKAGSQQVIISSSKRWVKITELIGDKERKLKDLLKEINNVDVTVVEGYKKDLHPKIEIIKNPLDSSTFMFNNLKNIIAIITDTKIDSCKKKQFKTNEINKIVEFILKNND